MSKKDEGFLLDPIPSDLLEEGYHYDDNGQLVDRDGKPFES